MIDRLHDMLPQLEQLPPESQEEIAAYIEAVLESTGYLWLIQAKAYPAEAWEDPAGSCSDLPDTTLEDLDRLRHETAPTPP